MSRVAHETCRRCAAADARRRRTSAPPSVPSPRDLRAQVTLRVAMTCDGCAGAVRRVLGKLEGVESVDIDVAAQKGVVKGTVGPDVLVETVGKTGKATSLWA